MPLVNFSHDIRLFVEDWGRGKPIVFVHGWPLSHRMFEYQAADLVSHGHRVVTFDLRGFGDSDKPYEGNNYDAWAEDIGKVLRDRSLRNATLVGFCLGGAIAMHYIATHNEPKVDKLMLVSAAGPCLIRKHDNPAGVPRQIWDKYLEAESQDRPNFKHIFSKDYFAKPVSVEMQRWLETIGMEASAHASLQGLEEMGDRDLRLELGEIKIPTKILHGLKDKIVPFPLAEEQNRLIKGSQLLRFHNSGHGLFLDEKEKLLEEILRFHEEGNGERVNVPIQVS